MKKIITIMMVLVLVVALAVPALAADIVTSDEQALYDHFCSVVDKWAKNTKYQDRANQYKAMALQTLVDADLDASACADLDATINSVDSMLASENPTTPAEMKALMPSIVSTVNATANKYDITVAVSSSSELAQTYVGGKAVVVPSSGTGTGTGSGSGTGVVKQTGFDMTNTIIVAAVLAVALLGSAVVIGKKRLAVNN